MSIEQRKLAEEYENIKKIIIKKDYTKEEKRKINIFKERMNEYFKKQKDYKSFKKFLDNFNKATDDLLNNQNEFISSSDILFEYFNGSFRR